jgi:hypothetical protein
MQRQVHIVFENYLKRHLDGKNYFAVDSIQITAEGKLVIIFHGWSNVCFVYPSPSSAAWDVKLLN